MALVAALLAGVVTAGPAAADDTVSGPTQPSTSDEAKAAWIAAAQSGEQLNQALLTAQQQVTDAQTASSAGR